MFLTREQAGRQLAAKLFPYKDKNPLVLALPRGGVPVAFEVARTLETAMDLLIVRRLCFPKHPQVAFGAIVSGSKEIFLNTEMFGLEKISASSLEKILKAKSAEVDELERVQRNRRPLMNMRDRTVLLVDDGIATGATMRAAVRYLRHAKAGKVVAAAPVASTDAVNLLKEEADDVVCVNVPHAFNSVSQFYGDFHHVSDEAVTAYTDRIRRQEYDHVLS